MIPVPWLFTAWLETESPAERKRICEFLILNFIVLGYFVYLHAFFFKDFLHCLCLQTHHKGASGLITDGCEPLCGCLELISGLLEEQPALLTTEPSVWPYTPNLKNKFNQEQFRGHYLKWKLLKSDLFESQQKPRPRFFVFFLHICNQLCWLSGLWASCQRGSSTTD